MIEVRFKHNRSNSTKKRDIPGFNRLTQYLFGKGAS
jgi:hypothetical protein